MSSTNGNGRKPLEVYAISPISGSASYYYRIDTIALTCQDLGLPVRYILDRNGAEVSHQDRVRGFCEADVIQVYQPIGEGPISSMKGVQSFIPSKRDGKWKWPPTVVVETDDNLFNVSPLNQAYRTLGIRDMNGELIPPGHHIGVVEHGIRKVMWYDTSQGEPTERPGPDAAPINLVRNRQTIASWRTILTLADCVSCSTPEVERALRAEEGCAPYRTRVFPNLIRLRDFEQVDVAEEPGVVKILWQGGIAHYEDWYPLREQLGRITRKYPQVQWIIWGAQWPWVNELIPAHRLTFKSWCPYYEYKLRLAMVGHDISLAPLSDNRFNRCRSAIKFYESSVLRKPAATLAQNTAAYREEIVNGETALLFSTPQEFEDQLSRLIEDATERKRLAANAKDWVSENRDAMKKVPGVIAFWEQLREERKREQPHPTEAQWAAIEAEDRAEQQRELEAAGAGV